MAENNRNVVKQENSEKKAQPSESKKTPTLPKLTEWAELDDATGGPICDITTGQCTV